VAVAIDAATADERCADANIFASTRNTVYVCGAQAPSEDRYPVLPSAASAVRDIMTCKCPQLNAR